MKNFKVRTVPVWAGLVAVAVVSYVVNNFALPMYGPLSSIPEQGPLPYGITAAGVVGMWFAFRGNDDRARVAGGVCTALGLFGTATGLALMSSAKGSAAYDGLTLSFVSTSQGVLMLVLIEFLLIWPMPTKALGRSPTGEPSVDAKGDGSPRE